MEAYKLDETIKEFKSEVEKVKSVNEIYTRIEATYKEIIYNVGLYKKGNEKIIEIKNKLESTLMNYEEFQGKLMNLNNSIKENMEKEIEALKSDCRQLNENILVKIESLDAACDKRFFEIRKENVELYQELEKLLSSKLERVKSDIEVSIRDGNVNLERVIGTQFDLKFIQFNELIEKKSEKLDKKMSRISMVSLGILALVVINVIFYFMYK